MNIYDYDWGVGRKRGTTFEKHMFDLFIAQNTVQDAGEMFNSLVRVILFGEFNFKI